LSIAKINIASLENPQKCFVCPSSRDGFRAWLNPGHENISSALRQAMKLVASQYVVPSVRRRAMRFWPQNIFVPSGRRQAMK
jgi:hypothetical protein